MLVQVRDAQGAVVAKHVVGVGAIQPGDSRTFSLQVEMRAPEEAAHPAAAPRVKQEAPAASHGSDGRKA